MKKKIKINDLGEMKFLASPYFNKSGSLLAYVESSADLDASKYPSHIRLYDFAAKKDRLLTSGEGESNFIWLDDENLLFSAVRSEKDRERAKNKEEFTAFYKINVHGGEAEKLFEIPARAHALKAVNSGRFLFVMTSDLNGKDLFDLNEKDKAAELKRRKDEEDYKVLEEIPFWLNGGHWTSHKRSRLCSYDLTKKKLSVLTTGCQDLNGCVVSEDGKQALVWLRNFKDMKQLHNSLYHLDLTANKLRLLRDEKELIYGALFIDDMNAVLLGNEQLTDGRGKSPVFMHCSLKDGKTSQILPGQDMSIGSSIGSDVRLMGGDEWQVADGAIYFIQTDEADSKLNRLSLDGKLETLYSQRGSIDCFDRAKDGRIVFVSLPANELQRLEMLGPNGKLHTLVNPNKAYNASHAISPVIEVRAKGEEGYDVQGWVIKPVDYQEGKKYPAILDIHGGPRTAYGETFFHEMQVWASEGFFVFFCNPHGSDGRGNAFADLRGRYGTIDYRNIMSFCDTVLKEYPAIDPRRVGVTGGSYGGFMTNWIIGHTDRFAAACSQRSISNWTSFFCSSDIGYYFGEDQCDGNPWEDQDKLWEQSPLKYADKAKTPTLFIHSDEDYRCWMAEGLQMFTALKYHGVESRLCLFHGENHELSRSGAPKHRIRRLTEITDWFKKYLMS